MSQRVLCNSSFRAMSDTQLSMEAAGVNHINKEKLGSNLTLNLAPRAALHSRFFFAFHE